MKAIGRSDFAPVAALTAATFVLIFWGVGRVDPHYYYTTAVRSMSTDWHNFLYGALDPAGSITADKLPGTLWIQALSVRLFGFHDWALLLPEALAAALTVPLLYDAVRRWVGRAAGLLAAVVFALTPVTVVLARVNIPDTLLVLCLVGAARATTCALEEPARWRHSIAAAFWVGLGFQMKMAQVFLVVPALVLVYLVASPASLAQRVARLSVAGAIAAALSLAWPVLVTLTPASRRPFIDGSTHNSVWELLLGYNGLSRFLPQRAHGGDVLSFVLAFGGAPGPGRLWNAENGAQIGWLVPFAAIVLAAGLWSRRGAPRTDRVRAGWLLWGAWLVVHALVFSAAVGMHPYYTAALAPAIAALTGAGLVELGRRWTEGDRAAWSLPVGVGVTAAVALALSRRTPDYLPWLAPLVAVASLAAVALLVLGMRRTLALRWRHTAFVLATLGCILAPGTWAVAASAKSFAGLDGLNPVAGPGGALPMAGMASMHGFPPDTPLPPCLGDMNMLTPNTALLAFVRRQHQRERYLFAVPTANTAAPYIRAGYSVLPMGGFTGSAPLPSLQDLRTLVATGQLRYVMIGGFHGGMGGPVSFARQGWVAEHCAPVPTASYGGMAMGPPGHAESLFDCRPTMLGRAP